MTQTSADISAPQFIANLNDTLRYLEMGIVGGSSSSLRTMSADVSAQQFVTDLNYNLDYLDSNIVGGSPGSLIQLTKDANATQFVRDLNIDLDYLENGISGGSETSDTVLMQLQGGRIATATSSATTIEGNNVVGYPCASTNDSEFFNNCHTRLMLDIGLCTLTGVTVESGETLTIFCYNSSGEYIQYVSSVGSIPSGTRYVKFMVSKSTAYTSLRKLRVLFQGNATQAKNITPEPVTTSYFSFDTEYPSMDASGNIIYTGANSQSRYYDNGMIKLPPNYSTTGDPVPLVVFVHGTNGFDFYKGPKPLYGEQQGFVANNGYALCDCSGITNVGKYLLTNEGSYDNTYFSPSFITCLHSLVEYVNANYNVKTDGVYLISKSAGGYTLHLLTQLQVLNIKAAASLAPGISTFGNMDYYTTSSNRAMKRTFGQLGITLTSSSWSTNKQIVLNNIHKLRQIDPLFFGTDLTDEEVESLVRVLYYKNSLNKKQFSTCSECMNGVTITEGSMSEGTGLPAGTVVPGINSVGINFHVPTWIWIADDDVNVSPKEANLYAQMSARGGSPCGITKISGGKGAHHAVDTASNAPKVRYQTKYAGEVEIVKAYAQLVDWFNNDGLTDVTDNGYNDI